MQGLCQRFSNTRASGIANGNRAVDFPQGGRQHVAELVFVFRRHHGHVGETAEIGQVEDPMMRAAVISGKTGAVDGERHRQPLQANIMDDLIVGTLEKS
jgi:hypothetical protein